MPTAPYSCYVQESDVRQFVADNETRAGMAGFYDLDFTPEDIADAMVSAAREFNSIPPYVSTVQPNMLSKTTNMFLDVIAYFLYMRALQYEQRHDVPYTAGSVTVDVAARKIAHFTNSMKMFYDRFLQAARSLKKQVNITRAYGGVG